MALVPKRFPASGTGIPACVAGALVAIFSVPASADFRSPLDDASAVQQQLRQVVDQSARSVFAVTAFTTAPTDAAFYSGRLDGMAFAALADSLGRSCGSAFAIDSAGHLLTNEHVVSGAASVWVTDDQGNVLPAVVVGTDPRTDLAVLEIPSATTPLIAASDLPTRGELVVAIGNPDGLATGGELSASVGCVSATGRSLPTLSAREHRNYADLLQMTTPVAVGGSGGPLVGLDGRALGVVSAVATADRDGMPVGFAIPLSQITLARITKLSRGDEVVHPYFGVAIGPADAPSTQPADRSTPRGARIDRVESNTPADGVLIEGDVVLEVGGKPVESDRQFLQLAGACQIDQPVSITVRRAGSLQSLLLSPTRRPLPADPVTRQTQRFVWAGVTFVNDEHAVRVSSVDAGATMPLEAGAIVRRIEGEAVPDVATLARILHANAGQTLALDVAQGN
jgi:S1-C subfamily serine protease